MLVTITEITVVRSTSNEIGIMMVLGGPPARTPAMLSAMAATSHSSRSSSPVCQEGQPRPPVCPKGHVPPAGCSWLLHVCRDSRCLSAMLRPVAAHCQDILSLSGACSGAC